MKLSINEKLRFGRRPERRREARIHRVKLLASARSTTGIMKHKQHSISCSGSPVYLLFGRAMRKRRNASNTSTIYPDEAFWTKEMDRKICTFYYDHLLPKSKDKQKTDSVPEEQRYHNYSVRLNNVIDITAAYLLLFRLPASDCDAIHPVGGN